MSETEPIIEYVFTWHALSDACPKCRQLDGREYREQNLFQDVLWDQFYGNIWDLNVDRSLMHGASGTCRCQLEVRVEKVDFEALSEFQDLSNIMERFI